MLTVCVKMYYCTAHLVQVELDLCFTSFQHYFHYLYVGGTLVVFHDSPFFQKAIKMVLTHFECYFPPSRIQTLTLSHPCIYTYAICVYKVGEILNWLVSSLLQDVCQKGT